MKEQLIEMGFVEQSDRWLEYELETCTLIVDMTSCNIIVEDDLGDSVLIAQHATIEQISNILKSIQI